MKCCVTGSMGPRSESKFGGLVLCVNWAALQAVYLFAQCATNLIKCLRFGVGDAGCSVSRWSYLLLLSFLLL